MPENAKKEKYWYLRSKEEVLKETNSSLQGISEEQAKSRLEQEGLNSIAKEEKHSVILQFLSGFNNILIYILTASAIISLISDHIIEFVVIMLIIFLTVLTGFIQEQRAGKAVSALSKLTPKIVNVLRAGKKKQILSEHLVTGDIVILERGMIVPADLRILESKTLTVNESILTGESVLKQKHSEKIDKQDLEIQDMSNIAFSGTSITSGSGLGVVVEKGLKSELGKISNTIKNIEKAQTPLHKKIDVLGKRISTAVIIIAVVFFILLIARKYNTYEALLLVGAILVSGIPESFPLALTLSLSSGVKRMAKENAIVKDLGSVETLGTTTVICTDKTGTLTQNKMVVEKIFFASGEELNVHVNGYEPSGTFTTGHKLLDKKNLSKYDDFFKACVLCNNSSVSLDEGEWKLAGEPTEGALLACAKSAGFDDEVLKEDDVRLHEIPFDPANKYMITVNKNLKKQSIAYLKGAVEKVLERSTHIRASKSIRKITSSDKKKILGVVDGYTAEALRVLALASKKVSMTGKEKNFEKNLKGGFIFEGLVGIEDPLRPDVSQSVKECHEAGIRVIMITGDHISTAQSIGLKLGLIKGKDELVLTGPELDKMSDEDIDNVISRVSIFARTTPEHKLRIVSSLQRKGEIVAMTGDGVNDAPALKKADIGIAMGKGGTDVARESSNMVLADDNFSTIVKAVKEGRTIYSNIRRFIYYLLTGNFTEVSLVIFAVLVGVATPLTALMVLFINLCTSTFPAMALSIEPTHMKVMKQKPRNPKEKVLSSYILLKILVLVPLLLFGTFSLFLFELSSSASLDKARTLAFAALVMFELFHSFNARSLHSSIFNRNFFKNKFLFASIFFSLSLMLLSIYTVVGQKIFHVVPLGLLEWVIILVVSSLVVVVSEIIKLLIRSEFEEQMHLKGVNMKIE